MSDVTDLFEFIDAHPELVQRPTGPLDEELVQAAERAIGYRFPPSYREFLLRYGTAEVDNEDIAGLIGPEFENGAWPNAVWLNLTNRREFGQGARYFVFYNWGDGTDSALDLERRDAAGESPVVEAHAGAFEAHGKETHASFAAFLLERLREALARES